MLSKAMLIRLIQRTVSRAVKSKGKSSCKCDCVYVCKVLHRQREGRKGGLSSPAYSSTKDNLTLPLGLLPRLPTWHSFYFCSSPLLCWSHYISFFPSLLIWTGIPTKHHVHTLVTLLLLSELTSQRFSQSTCFGIFTLSYRSWFVHGGRKLFGCFRELEGLLYLKTAVLTVINPPTRSFVWGSSSLVPSCGE